MNIPRLLKSPQTVLYFSIFLVTQVAGLLISLIICFILQDFIWGFVRMSLVNSFVLGCALIGTCYLTQRQMFVLKIPYILLITFLILLGVSVISFLFLLMLEPTLFLYYDRGAFSFLVVNFLFILALHIISSALIMYREITLEKENALSRERNLKNRMEMHLLSSKVNPHFLFNTLNMILNLLKEPQKAETAILNLSDLLRHNLEQSEKPAIAVSEEIENARKYLEIQNLRFPEKLTYEITTETDFPVPPLIIQPLIENSIKHNIREVSHLHIEIDIRADDGKCRIIIRDSEKKVRESMLHKGQGLTVTKKRVENSGGVFEIKNGEIEILFNQK